MDKTSGSLGRSTVSDRSNKNGSKRCRSLCKAGARASTFPGKSQPESGLVQLKNASRSAEIGKNHSAPLSRDNDKLGVSLATGASLGDESVSGSSPRCRARRLAQCI